MPDDNVNARQSAARTGMDLGAMVEKARCWHVSGLWIAPRRPDRVHGKTWHLITRHFNGLIKSGDWVSQQLASL
jgi:hypothetical protein